METSFIHSAATATQGYANIGTSYRRTSSEVWDTIDDIIKPLVVVFVRILRGFRQSSMSFPNRSYKDDDEECTLFWLHIIVSWRWTVVVVLYSLSLVG